MKARKVITAPARGLKALSQMMFSRQGGLVWRFMPRTRFDYAREIGDGMSSSLIMAPILWMARTFPEAPIQVLDGEDVEVERHPMVQLLRRPNKFYSGITLWMATLISWVLDGNAYWIKVRNQMGGVIELWYVPHWLMKPIGNETEFVSYYRYEVDGQMMRLDPSDVVHLRYGLDPRNPRKGLSPLGTLFREIFTDEEASNFSASLLRNVGVPGLIVSPEGDAPSEDDVEATKDYIKEQFGGDRRGEPLVFGGPTKVQQFGFSPEQMDVKTLRRIPEERVTAAIGLPAIVVGFGAGLERSTFANYAEAREAAYEQCIIPTQRHMAEEIRHQLLPDFEDQLGDLEVAFDLSKVRVLQEDRNKEAARVGTLYTRGVITRGEARKAIGEESSDADEVFVVSTTTQLTPASEPPGDPDPLPAEEAAKGIKADALTAPGGTPELDVLITQFNRQASDLELHNATRVPPVAAT